MAKKPKQTPEEKQEAQRIKRINSAMKSLITKVKNCCKNGAGLNAIQIQRDFLQNNNTILPNSLLDKQQTVNCFDLGIAAYKETLGR
ncbi:MAG TPA: hypothetical protein VEA37_14050 [Flavobacterium sp.]|nr:hypothetical protein [Flavobacterium sp.]